MDSTTGGVATRWTILHKMSRLLESQTKVLEQDILSISSMIAGQRGSGKSSVGSNATMIDISLLSTRGSIHHGDCESPKHQHE